MAGGVPPGDKERVTFIKATYALAKQNPHAWAEFFVAFNAYTLYELEQGTAGSTEYIPIAMGMSRRMLSMRNDFRDIETLMGKIAGGK